MNTKRKLSLPAWIFIAMIAGIAIGGTIAWLQDTTKTVTNEFTTTDISVTLTEEGATAGTDGNMTREYEFVPSVNLPKAPYVTASCDVDYYVFVKVEPVGWVKDINDNYKYILYDGEVECSVYSDPDSETDKGWMYLPTDDTDGYVYYQIKTGGEDFEDYVLTGDEVNENGVVIVKSTLTDEDMNPENGAQDNISLTFTAYAIQQVGFDNATAAWNAAKTNN